LLKLGYVGHVDEISRRNRRQARHIIDCAKSLGSLKRLIHRFRDPLHVGLNRVGERSHDNERLALKKHAYDALVARLPYRRRTRNLIL